MLPLVCGCEVHVYQCKYAYLDIHVFTGPMSPATCVYCVHRIEIPTDKDTGYITIENWLMHMHTQIKRTCGSIA